jgi:dTDP-4-dehydrorhamnose reductase
MFKGANKLKAIVTGASGLFGSCLVELALKEGFEVYSGYYEHLVNIGHPFKLNVTNSGAIMNTFSRIRPDIVVHAAALTDVDLCERDKVFAYQTNIDGTRNIIDACRRFGVYLVYISTDYVFQGDKGMYKEDDSCSPVNYYGNSKLESEKLVKSSGLDYLVVRASVIFGSRPALGKVNFALWALEKLRKEETIHILVDQFISPTLNSSLAEMVLEAVNRWFTGVYHMSGATRLSRFDFVTKLAEIFDLDRLLIRPAKMGDMNWFAMRPNDSSLDVRKATSQLRHKPLNIDEAVRRLKFEMEGLA